LQVAGTLAGRKQNALPRLGRPENADVHGYLARMGFFEAA
jgi:hypothetical protein